MVRVGSAIGSYRFSRAVVPLVGVSLLALLGYTVLTGGVRGPNLFVVASVPAVVGVSLTVFGVRIVRADLTDADSKRLLSWFVVGLVANLAIGAWYGLLVAFDESIVTDPVAHLTNLSIGCLFGILVGWYSVRLRRTVEQMTVERTRRSYLEERQETLELLDRTLRHHLLNALNVVDGRARLAEDAATDEVRDHLTAIRARVVDIVDTITDTRHVVDTLDDASDRYPVHLGGLLRTELELVRESYPDTEFADATATDLDYSVPADHLLSLAVSNLLHNAAQHNDAESPRVELSVRRSPAETTITVSDNGPGVPDDRKASMFEMGRRGAGSRGTGMGLFLSRRIAERYGGTLSVADVDPRGAAFSLTIPHEDGSPDSGDSPN